MTKYFVAGNFWLVAAIVLFMGMKPIVVGTERIRDGLPIPYERDVIHYTFGTLTVPYKPITYYAFIGICVATATLFFVMAFMVSQDKRPLASNS